MNKSVQSYWNECLSLLRRQLTESAYNKWFLPIQPISYNDGKLVLQLQSYAVADHIEDNYIKQFSSAIFSTFGVGTNVEYRILIDSHSGADARVVSDKVQQEQTRNEVLGGNPQAAYTPPREQVQQPALQSRLNPNYTFESFVPGECNKLVRSVSLAAAKSPGHNSFNPLFIYGGSGVGKTHLLNAIGNQVKQLYPQKRVLYVSANEFKTQYMNAGQTGRVADFLQFYQTIDVLLIDDIQFLAGSSQQKTQEQFFHIFNYLHQSNKQIVMTSDRPPLDIKDIEDRLLTRFKWGFQGEMGKPDYSLRRDILRNKMLRDGIDLPDEVISFIAENVRDNVRDLEGVLVSLLAYSTIMDSQIDISLAEKVVSNVVEIGEKEVDLKDILDVVSAEYGVDKQVLLGTSRQKEISMARQVAMHFSKKMTNHSLQEIGDFYGHRTHATVLHSCTTIKEQAETNPMLRQKMQRIENKLRK